MAVIGTASETATQSTCGFILSRLAMLLSRTDALGDRIGCVSQQLVGSEPTPGGVSAGAGQKPVSVPNGFFDEVQNWIDQVTMSLTKAEDQLGRLDRSGTI